MKMEDRPLAERSESHSVRKNVKTLRHSSLLLCITTKFEVSIPRQHSSGHEEVTTSAAKGYLNAH